MNAMTAASELPFSFAVQRVHGGQSTRLSGLYAESVSGQEVSQVQLVFMDESYTYVVFRISKKNNVGI